MWDLPGSGIELVSPALAGGFFTIGPPGKPLDWCLLTRGAFSNVWRRWLPRMGGCYWHLMGGDQGCCSLSCTAQDAPTAVKHPDVSSAGAEKSSRHGRAWPLSKDKIRTVWEGQQNQSPGLCGVALWQKLISSLLWANRCLKAESFKRAIKRSPRKSFLWNWIAISIQNQQILRKLVFPIWRLERCLKYVLKNKQTNKQTKVCTEVLNRLCTVTWVWSRYVLPSTCSGVLKNQQHHASLRWVSEEVKASCFWAAVLEESVKVFP